MSDVLIRWVALGDSTAVGVGAEEGGGYVERLFQRLRADGLPVGLLNLAQSGATSSDVVSFQLPKAARARPAFITLAIGGNDLWRQTDEGRFAANVDQTLRTLAEAGARGVVANLPDMSHAPVAQMVPLHAYGPRLLAFNASIARSTTAHGFQLIDLFSESRAVLPDHPEYFCADGFHPSAAGYDHWATVMWEAVRRIARAHVPPPAHRPGGPLPR